MHPYALILFLMSFTSFLPFTCADSWDAGILPEYTPGSDIRDEWTGLLSNIADKIQEALFVIPPTTNSDEAQAYQSTSNGRLELLQQRLAILLSEETGKIIRSFETVIGSSVALRTLFYDVLDSDPSSDNVPSSTAPFIPLLKTVEKLVAIARDDIRANFPLPATAPGHAERVKRVSNALERLQHFVVRLAKNYDIEQEAIERHLVRAKPFLRDAGVLVGDVTELYPAAIEALFLNLSTTLLPEAILLRSLVTLYCFGPYVLGKDAISGWLLKHVSETLKV